jgi:hypothetical protein
MTHSYDRPRRNRVGTPLEQLEYKGIAKQYRLDLKRIDPEKMWVQRIEVAEIKEIRFNNPAHSRSQ